MTIADMSQEELVAQAARACNELSRREDVAAEEENRLLVGKCFKFRNNYSVQLKPSDYWWLYRKVLAVNGRTVTVLDFQTYNYVHVTVQEQATFCAMADRIQIPVKEFDAAWTKMIAHLMAAKDKADKVKS